MNMGKMQYAILTDNAARARYYLCDLGLFMAWNQSHNEYKVILPHGEWITVKIVLATPYGVIRGHRYDDSIVVGKIPSNILYSFKLRERMNNDQFKPRLDTDTEAWLPAECISAIQDGIPPAEYPRSYSHDFRSGRSGFKRSEDSVSGRVPNYHDRREDYLKILASKGVISDGCTGSTPANVGKTLFEEPTPTKDQAGILGSRDWKWHL